MPIKTILVCMTTKENAETLMKAAVPLARRHGAHLVGLHTLQALEVYPGVAIHVTADVYQQFNSGQQQEADAIQAVFEAYTENEDFISEWRLLKAQATMASERMVESARAADLVIMAHEDKKTDRYDQRRAQSAVIRQSGRPVIVIPMDYDGPEVGQNLLVGWSDTREAARAVHDALTLAGNASHFTLVRVTNRATDEMQDADILDVSTAISRHGHSVDVIQTEWHGSGITEELLKTAFEKGADLIVTGAFGHSAAYDFVVGATTSKLLKDANLPVLFSK